MQIVRKSEEANWHIIRGKYFMFDKQSKSVYHDIFCKELVKVDKKESEKGNFLCRDISQIKKMGNICEDCLQNLSNYEIKTNEFYLKK